MIRLRKLFSHFSSRLISDNDKLSYLRLIVFIPYANRDTEFAAIAFVVRDPQVSTPSIAVDSRGGVPWFL